MAKLLHHIETVASHELFVGTGGILPGSKSGLAVWIWGTFLWCQKEPGSKENQRPPELVLTPYYEKPQFKNIGGCFFCFPCVGIRLLEGSPRMNKPGLTNMWST